MTSRHPLDLFYAGIVLLLVLSGMWLAPRWGELAVPAQVAMGVMGCGVILVRASAMGVTPGELGVRGQNLLGASLVLGCVTVLLVAPVVAFHGGAGAGSAFAPFPPGELPSYFAWALFQQFVAVGGFWLPLRRAWGLDVKTPGSFGSELALAGTVALVFASAHAPNVGLMALVGVAECVWLLVFARLRWRNLFSLSLAHAAAALVIAHHLVPAPWLPSMRVGIDYLRSSS